MNVSFLENNPVNSIIVDSNGKRPLYEVHTPWKLVGSRTTTVRRLKPGVAPGTGEIIAEVHWHTLSSSTITLFGSTMAVNDWLKKDGWFSSSRVLTTSDGNSYKWTHGNFSKKFTLQNTSTGTEIAQSHRRKFGLFGGGQKRMNIEISSQGTHILDTIIVSFIILEEKARQSEKSSEAASV